MNQSTSTSVVIGSNAVPLHVDKAIGHNAYIGHQVALSVVVPSLHQFNTAIGSDTIAANTGYHNTAVDHDVLSKSSDAHVNTVIGYECMKDGTSDFKYLHGLSESKDLYWSWKHINWIFCWEKHWEWSK